MAIEIVDFSHEKWWIFPVRYVKLPEGNTTQSTSKYTGAVARTSAARGDNTLRQITRLDWGDAGAVSGGGGPCGCWVLFSCNGDPMEIYGNPWKSMGKLWKPMV